MVLNSSPRPDLNVASGRGTSVTWLGQAGFLVELSGLRVVIDPYLSDSLAEKYKGKKYPHVRMMPAPISPEELLNIDWILCTHGHTDHMDPGSLPGLILANPNVRVLVPRSEAQKAIDIGIPQGHMVLIDAGERLQLAPMLSVTATASAHEDLSQNAAGEFIYLGYVLKSDDVTIWHSGDTIPYAGLADRLGPQAVDLALLPINGRDALRASNGVPGNLTCEEAIALSELIGARAMIGHHFGLFEFNTADPHVAQDTIDKLAPKADVQLARMNETFSLMPSSPANELRILAVCRGNICRSPTAEAVIRARLGDISAEVDSAAIMDWNVGRTPDPRSIKAASEQGVDISSLVARQITSQDFQDFDIILGMDAENMEALLGQRPKGARAIVVHFGAFLSQSDVLEIPDPYDSDDQAFKDVFQMITKAADGFVATLDPKRRSKK